jgi:hypothetical protein
MGMKDSLEGLGASSDDEEMAPESETGPDESGVDESDEFNASARSAFDASLPMDERIAALKSAIMECQGGYGGDSGGEKKPSSALSLIFGGKK